MHTRPAPLGAYGRIGLISLFLTASIFGCVTDSADGDHADPMGGASAGEEGALTLTPAAFEYSGSIELGGTSATVRLTNTGSAPVNISSVSVDREGEEDTFTLRWRTGSDGAEYMEAVTAAGEDRLAYPVIMASGASLDLQLQIVPAGDTFPTGAVVLSTDLPESPTIRVPIEYRLTQPRIHVDPDRIDFGELGAGQTATQELVVSNRGDQTLTVERLNLVGNPAFTVSMNDDDAWIDATAVEPPVAAIIPGDQRLLRVRYATADQAANAVLNIESDDPTRPTVAITLRGGFSAPCLEVTPAAVEFRSVPVDESEIQMVTLRACGSAPVQVNQVTLTEASDPAYSLGDAPQPSPFVLGGPDGPEEVELPVFFGPLEDRIHNGSVVIESDDERRPTRRISLLGRGVENACPHANVPEDEITVRPLEVVVLDGSPSFDPDGPDGQPVAYEWVFIDRPAGSVSSPHEAFFDPASPANGGVDDDPSTPQAVFFVDLPGVYTAELRVRDANGLTSTACGHDAQVTIVAQVVHGLHIQLVWRTPADEIVGDNQGTDLDLHLLHPFGDTWFSAPYDCYQANPIPEWGQLEYLADDPLLDLDDIDGDGPENILLEAPQNTDELLRPYVVGVYYAQSADRVTGTELGSSFATIRVFVGGELAWENPGDPADGREMLEAGDFWEAVQIEWPGARVTSRNRYHPGFRP